MSIDSGMKAVIHNRRSNFFDRFNEFMEDDEYYFTRRTDPDFDFIEKYDADGNPVYSDPDKAKIYNVRMARFKATKIVLDSNLNIYYTDDESSDFFGYSYDEIIGMHNDGVVIPEEILSWAYAMADANTLEVTAETEGGSNDAQELYIELKNNPFLNIKTITKIFVNKCEEQTDELEAYLDEIDPIEKEMESAKTNAETEKQKSLNDIKSLTSEWKELQTKVKNGQELSDSEKDRLDEIQNLFADKDDEYQDKVDNITKNFTKIGEKLSIITEKADTAFDFGEQTIVVAKELAEYENTHRKNNLFGGIIGESISGLLGILSLTGNKRFSETAHTVGVDTEYFAKDINTTIQEVQLLMQETADTAGFSLEDSSYTAAPLTSEDPTLEPIATTTTSSNSASGDEPEPPVVPPTTDPETPEAPEGGEPTEGGDADGVDGADETPDDEDDSKTDEELTKEGEKTLEDVDAKKLDPISLQRLIKAEGEDSEKKGKDATKLVEQLQEQSAIVDDKEAKVEQKRTEAEEASEEEPAEGTDNEDDLGDVQVEVEESQTDLDAATEDEALTVEGLRETFKGYKKANKKYVKDVDYSNDVMTGTMFFGNGVIIGGGTLSGFGIANIITGNSLLAAGWWNPAAWALGAYLIGLGVNQTAIGAAMISSGTALTLLAETGFEINEETGEKITTSSKDIAEANDSLDEIERQQMEELGLEAPEKSEDEEDEDEIEKTGIEKDKDILAKMQEGNTILPDLREQSVSEGNKSADLGEENVTELTELERQTPELIETTIAFEQAKQQKEAMSMTSEEDNEVENVQDPKETYDKYRNDFKADLETNNEFKQDIKTTDEEAKTNLNLALLGDKNGTIRTSLGASEVAAGTILVAQFWNPMAVKLGLKLIERGNADIALGSEMVAAGLALTVNSTTTLIADAIASSQIAESDKKTNDSIERVDQIEAEINAAVEEQLAATGEKDLSGMSTIELLTLIIMNGINASVLGVENSELIEALKEKLPEILEEVKASAATESAENTEIIEETEETETPPENDNQDNNGEDDDNSIFAQYKNDFETDLTTNETYSSEIKQAEEMSSIIKSSFFLGAPVKKATNKINESKEQTSQALDEVAEMEKQVEEAKKAAQAEQETQTIDAVTTTTNASAEEIDPKDSVDNAADEEEDAADAVEDDADEVEKNAKAEKKEEKNQKKVAKKEKKQNKALKKGKKTVEKKEKEGQENEKDAANQIAVGEETVTNSGQDDSQTTGDQTTEELGEAESISGEVESIVAEATSAVAEATSAIQAATNENQAIVGEMTTINSSLQQDQIKLTNLGNQLKQKEKEASSGAPAQAPQQPAQAPAQEPQTPPQPAPKKTNAAKKPQQPEKPEQPEQPAPQQPVQAPQKPEPVDAEPTVQEAPAGSDKTQFASDNEKQPDFVGFVAQSDSLASGSVLANSAPKKTTTPSNQNNANPAQKKTTQNKQAANKKQNNNTQNANNNEEQQALPQPKAAKRTAPKAFDINAMAGGGAGNGGNDETKGIRVSMQAVRAAAFNKQARLNNMQIRANNNVAANIQKEAQAQAAAARQERLAREKQERIAKIKEFAGYAQMAGGLTTTAGMIVEIVGTATVSTGTAQVTNGTAVVAQGVSNLSLATGLITTGTSTITIGTTQIAIGVTELGVGTVAVTTGTAAEAAGTATETTGTVLVASGTPLLSNPFTAAAGAALVASGTTTKVSGTATMGSGAALISSGAVEITTGAATEGTGAGTVVTGTATLTTATMDAAKAAASITSGTALIATGSATIASGSGLIATGGVIQAVGTYVTAAAAATSAAADMANGNILGGLATIVGAAASVVGVSAPVSQLGNAAIQLGAQGTALAGQLATNNAGQNNNSQQNKKKKKAFKQNPNTQKIIDKTQKRAQAVSNRFNKNK